ncbi:hypothetical protein DRB17_17140 [Ferruginivarius sediminum]|uniref:Uncharacterized protein n=1 Tax=Ferruginivarius sediminum TaxID=2661937 RepID=A0A369T8V3_9PROT|nr:hypothetical protein DRB17_17140 [Ferruginivarius sediminum]
MRVTAWSNGRNGYGVRVGARSRDEHFDPAWDHIFVEIDGAEFRFSITPSFWRKCPEFRGRVLRDLFYRQGLAPWPKDAPPVFDLIPLGGGRFRLELDAS